MTRTILRAGALAGAAALALAAAVDLGAQRAASNNVTVDPSLYAGLTYRSLGFSRGGRSTAVAGVRQQPLVYYHGSTGGGVWKTDDAGMSWRNISDGFFGGGIGAIAVAEADPNVVYVGTGSACPRGNISAGTGFYKSMDAGKSWDFIGLPDAGQVSRIQVHPKDPNLVYAAVLGNIFGESDQRGIYRSKDGGATWEKVLFVSNRTGASDLSMDPGNPRILYAGMWHMYRTPWTIHSGSMDGGVYRSTDGGDTWTRLSGGLPTDVMVGKTAVSVSPADPDRIWVLIEAADDKGGVYRSDDGGETWTRTNDQRMLQQRAWYYIHIHADPVDPDTVWASNVGFFKSTDGGRTFQQYRTPHSDNHDLWINPDNPRVMINANDGGANVSMNGAESWTTQMNQPTAEIYRVTTDTREPYWVYGAQQDNSTAALPGGLGGGFGADDFYAVGGGESGHIAVDPDDYTTVYAGSYGGTISKFDAETRTAESIRAYPDSQTGQKAADMKYRFQWNAPIRISPHDSNVIYHASQYVHRSMDKGKSWDVISPDLTRNDPSKQDYSGKDGVSRDNTGVEVYNTIFALEESPAVPGLIWTGADDGKMHITRDNGKTWTDITPAGMPEGTLNMIDLSAHDPGRAVVALYRYRRNDFQPYVYLTNDYGKTWKRLADGTNGIPKDHFVRVVREDPERKGLFYAGTERGMYVSFDDGANWQPLQLNLPIVPVTDLKVHRNDLVVSTQGRAFWVLEDLPVLRQIKSGMQTTAAHLFDPEDGYRDGGPPATFFYWLGDTPKQPVRIDVIDAKGETVATYTGRPGATDTPPQAGRGGRGRGGFGGTSVPARKGLNRFVWNGRYPALFEVPQGIVMWGGGGPGPRALPGMYTVTLTSGDWSQSQTFELKADPHADTTPAEYEAQLALAREVGLKVAELYAALAQIRDIKDQAADLGARMQRAGMGNEAAEAAAALSRKLELIEGELTQLQGEGGQDALNFPGRLDNQFVALYNNVAFGNRASKGMYERFEDIKPELARHLSNLEETLTSEVAAFNELIEKKGVKPLITRIK